jgi:hypothetical protein
VSGTGAGTEIEKETGKGNRTEAGTAKGTPRTTRAHGIATKMAPASAAAAASARMQMQRCLACMHTIKQRCRNAGSQKGCCPVCKRLCHA